jgi:probable phosphoglycerate mutase
VSGPFRVVAVRHAQSLHHVNGLTGGWTDTPLTELGHAQARRVAERLKRDLDGERVTLYASDLLRAAETAAHIAEALGVDAIADVRLREHNNGEAANMLFTDARERYPAAFDQAWGLDDRLLPGCESRRDLYDRVASFVEDVATVDGPIVVVTHGASMECVIGRWLGLTAELVDGRGFAVYPASITELTRDRFGRPLLERMNDIAHLQGLEVPA